MDSDMHVPVLAGRVTALLAPALAAEGAVLWTPRWAGPVMPAPCSRPVPACSWSASIADVAAIEAAGQRLAPYAARVTLVHARYDEIPAILAAAARTARSGRTA